MPQFENPNLRDHTPPDICVLSRQRVVSNSNGSSAYLLGLCQALAEDGHRLHLICPSPAMFGRWPVIVMGPEMAMFHAISIRGAIRIGRLWVAVSPTVLRRALVGIIGTALARVGLPIGALLKPAPYAVAQPWRREDLQFVARHAPANTGGVLADYAFLTEGISHAAASAPSAVVMHDLFSARPTGFGPLGGEEAAMRISEPAEAAMLDLADAVIAIQEHEAAWVRRHLPGKAVLVAPMAVTPVAAPQPGLGAEILFVGSNISANVDGLRWFLDEVWPAIRQAEPDTARLIVAGNVGRSFPRPPARVAVLGRVEDLAPLYARAAVVISPLRGGSGLKIKLIEALGHGKAVVTTSTTLQGVENIAGPAVAVADSAAAFAAAVIALLRDRALRQDHAAAALAVAQAHFSPAVCYSPVVDFFRRAQPFSPS